MLFLTKAKEFCKIKPKEILFFRDKYLQNQNFSSFLFKSLKINNFDSNILSFKNEFDSEIQIFKSKIKIEERNPYDSFNEYFSLSKEDEEEFYREDDFGISIAVQINYY